MLGLGKTIDKMMGNAIESCKQDDLQALALLSAGVDRNDLTPETLLSDLGSQQELLAKLQNISHLYITGSLAEDIIGGGTVGDVIGHLDKAKLSFVIHRLIKEEQSVVLNDTHEDLDSLSNNIT